MSEYATTTDTSVNEAGLVETNTYRIPAVGHF